MIKALFRTPTALRLTLSLVAAVLLTSPAAAQREVSIAEVQGSKNISPFEGKSVRVSGVVTARIRTGLFIQTPDGKTDGDPNTSEGIFVFTRTPAHPEAVVGSYISVTGEVEEFRRDTDTLSLTITEINTSKNGPGGDIKIIEPKVELPKPVILTIADFVLNQIDQLEKYEGMRVSVPEAVAVSATDGREDRKTGLIVSDGAFHAVLKGIPRPARTPGMDIREYLMSPDRERLKKEFPKLPIFDANPETLRIDTDDQAFTSRIDLGEEAAKRGVMGASQSYPDPLDVTAMVEVGKIGGVLHYSYGKYTILTDSTPAVAATIKPNPLPDASPDRFAVAGMNIENFFDDVDDPGIKEDVVEPEVFERRVKKISAAIRDQMKMPDIIGVIEAENLAGLKRLAKRINADAVAAGKPDPKYDAFLVDGNDGRGIDNGFLVKTARVTVIEAKQLGKDDKYKNPNTKEENFLNDRPPLMLRASINDPKTGKPFEFTAVVNHLKSFLGYNDPKQQDNVRMKKRLQAEFLAKFVQERQKADPAERIVLLGDFNAYQFNDGILDMIGIIKGTPAPKEEVLNFSPDIVEPDMVNLVDLISEKDRYSYVFDGNTQVLDHMLVTANMRKNVVGFGYARVNADFPEVWKNDASRPERFADHDPAVAYFQFDGAAPSQK